MTSAPGPPFYAAPVASTTKKQSTFFSTPLQDTSLHDVPGVGPVAHARLVAAGIGSSVQLMGHFLLLNRSEDAMAQWLLAVGVRVQEAGKIVAAIERKGRVMVAV